MKHQTAIERDLAPLSCEEIIGANDQATPVEAIAGESCIVPVPATMPSPPAAHPRLGIPTLTWAYLDTAGELIGYLCRFDPPGERKQFLPLTAWSDASGVL